MKKQYGKYKANACNRGTADYYINILKRGRAMTEADNNNSIRSIDNDLAQLQEGRPLERHAWLQAIFDNPNIGPNAYGQNPPRNVVLSAMLDRIRELSKKPRRDMELERATVELGRRFTSGPLYDGGSAVFEWVRATEVYEDLRTDWEVYYKADPKIVRSDIVGIGCINSGYALGKQLEGLGVENAERWFMSFRAAGIHIHIPFDAITEVVDSSTQTYTSTFNGHEHTHRYGSVIESPTDRSGMFHGWIQRGVA